MLTAFDSATLSLYLLVACRLAGCLAIFPAWNVDLLTVRWRLGLAVLLALLVTPSVASSTVDTTAWQQGGLPLMLVGLQEVGLGAISGVAVRLIWSAAAWTIQLFGPLSGLALTEAFDPGSGEASSALGQLFNLTIAATWLGLGGHRQLLAALLDTFQAAPPGSLPFDDRLVPLVLELLTRSCLAGIRAGAPLAAVLLALWLVVMGVTRLAPRSAAWVWGASLASLVGLVGFNLSLGYMSGTMHEHFDAALDVLRGTLGR